MAEYIEREVAMTDMPDAKTVSLLELLPCMRGQDGRREKGRRGWLNSPVCSGTLSNSPRRK